MAKSKPRRWLSWLWVVVLVIALGVRFWKIEYVPSPTDADELAYIWAGQSLLQFGTPISWSSFAHVDTQWHWVAMPATVVSQPEVPTAQFVRPWLDHSFVLPLLMGSWSMLLGYGFPSVPPALWYRLPFLLIAGVNLALIFATARRVFGNWPALFALSLISFSPSLIFAQRMVVSENLLATGMLLTIYFFVSKRPIWTLVLATSLAGLVKLPGLCITPVVLVALLSERRWRAALGYALGVAGMVGGGYLIYGWSIDWTVFLATMRDQSSRLLGWSNPAFLLSQPGFHTHAMLDLSYYLLLIFGGLIFFVNARRETRFLSGVLIASWLTIWVTSAEQDMLGWYKIPLFCVLAICSASVIELVFSKAKQLTKRDGHSDHLGKSLLSLLLVVMFLNNLGLVRYPTHPLPEAKLLRAVVGVVFGSCLLGLSVKLPRRVAQWVICGVMLGLAGQSLWFVDQYFAAQCRDRTCITPTVTFSQTVKSTALQLKSLVIRKK